MDQKHISGDSSGGSTEKPKGHDMQGDTYKTPQAGPDKRILKYNNKAYFLIL